jgi:hypothetical protein
MAQTDYIKQERPYSKPTLTVYGKVQELTKTIGRMGMGDGGTITNRKHTHA